MLRIALNLILAYIDEAAAITERAIDRFFIARGEQVAV
jgi:hypothetical protein